MMTNEEKTTLVEAANGLKRGMFVHIRGYVNSQGEKSNVTFHADANYERVHENSLKVLNTMMENPEFKIDICWNFYQDEQGTKHNRKAKGRTLITNHKETVSVSDGDLQEAVEKLRQSLTSPKEFTQEYNQIAKSTYESESTGKTYFRNVLIHSKEVVVQGVYPIKCTTRVNAIKDALEKLLPISKYRSYVIDVDGVAQLPDGTQVPKYEYVSIFHETISSSSSSESDD